MPPRKQETLELSGTLDIRQAEDIMESLKKVRSNNTNILLDFSKANDIDFAVIQILYSFKKALEEEKRKLRLESLNEKIISRIQLCDFESLLQEN